MNRLTILLGILAVGLVFLILNHDSGRTFGIVNDDFGRLVSLGAVGALIAAGLVQGRRHVGQSLRQFGIWVLIILVLVSGYLYRNDLQSFGDQLLRSVDIGDDRFKQIGTLDQPGPDPGPFVGADDDGHRVERPGPLLLVAGHAEGKAEVFYVAVEIDLESAGVVVALRQHAGSDRVPLGGDIGARAGEDIGGRLWRDIGSKRVRREVEPEQVRARRICVSFAHLASAHPVLAGLLRSSVIGNSPPCSSGGIAVLPGV